ncbi:protein-disulfide reductase DsbD family protein [Roseomonas sp. CCTCC AB2023176]|uniref:protein-disulfide reductase DsbD family protein n=1 Tax=Roseomonas sp. CCTCC AB2023176 TaxID=3342640 RepID=UPI0035D7C52E
MPDPTGRETVRQAGPAPQPVVADRGDRPRPAPRELSGREGDPYRGPDAPPPRPAGRADLRHAGAGGESDAVASERARVTLAADLAAVEPGGTLRLALRLRLAPRWHTYWTNPGDAGAPAEVELTFPDGGEAAPLRFPVPQRIPTPPLMSYGYEGEVALPLAVALPRDLTPGRLYTVEARANWLVCADVCIPEEGEFRLDIPVEAAARPDPATAALFRAAEAALPRDGVFQARAGFEGTRGAIEVSGEGITARGVREAFFFPATTGVLDHAAAQAMAVRDGVLTLGLTRGTAPIGDPLSGLVAITDAAGARSAYAVSAPIGPMPAAPGGTPLAVAAGLALLGGLILNLMPCVFPVLAMKAAGLARLSGAARGAVRAEALATVAGMVLSFLAIGGVLVGLRAAGSAAGWGFQFTSPVFVALMAWLMLAVGLNLSGVFAVGGPVGMGQGAASRGGPLGAFATGALAVIVATPCTAPFMATALGAALAMPPAGALTVFGALGLGMALPWALLAVAPGIARALPRPGAWMERLRGALAFPMYGAAAWLAWVLTQQAGPDGVLVLLGGAVLLGFGAWILGQAQAAGRGLRLGRAAAVAAVLGALALLPGLSAARAPEAATNAEAWSEERVAALRAEGRPVFVNVTAAWCITCKVNERVALDATAVREAFSRAGVATLVGDWTNGDRTLSALLRANARDGVPLYLLYPAGGGAPQVLPQILTERIVLDALASASARS